MSESLYFCQGGIREGDKDSISEVLACVLCCIERRGCGSTDSDVFGQMDQEQG